MEAGRDIPVGTCVDFATKKNSKRKKYGTKKFLWLTGPTFRLGRKYDSQPLPFAERRRI
jgi:hypothetical protein